jgi:hypothetical protein
VAGQPWIAVGPQHWQELDGQFGLFDGRVLSLVAVAA